jgi:hypothetical protein
MKIRHFLLYILVTVSLLNSCAPTVEPPADFGYNYIPIDTGRYYIYDVDSIRINLTATPYQNDTFHYQVKEFYPYTFIDGLGDTVVNCTRYYRTDTTQPWAITSGTNVWWLKRTHTRLEKTEENLTFVKMTYPIDGDYIWNGNAYNVLSDQNYHFGPMDINFRDDVNNGLFDINFNDGPILFDSTITITHGDPSDTNQVSYMMGMETYRRNVGLVHKKDYVIAHILNNNADWVPWPYGTLQWFEVPKLKRIKDGWIIEYKLIEYGFE